MSPILYRTRFDDPQTHLVSRPWQQWLEALCTRAGGYGDVESLTEVITAVGDLSAALTAVTTRVAALEAAAGLHQGTPTVAAVTTGAGSGATATVSGRDAAGTLSLTTASAQARRSHSAVLTLTFHTAYAAAPRLTLTPINDAAWALAPGTIRVRQADVTTTGFTLRSGRDRLPRPGDTYQWTYVVSA